MSKKAQPKTTTAAAVKAYKHKTTRKRIPTQEESATLSPREKRIQKKTYAYDPSFDPQLQWVGKYNPASSPSPTLDWAGKREQGEELKVTTTPIYVQEHVAPEALIARLKAGTDDSAQQMLFGETAQQQFDKAVEFYAHDENWKNRMILGDSLLAMNSLLEKEGMRGRVQTIYIDPPYGIKFGSNWQASTRKRDVKDNKIDDLVRQPEQIKAFRDTWELGIHSYLSYLRDRLLVARELLTESGSCFVQINDENVHLVRNIMDEVFGSENCAAFITVKKTTGAGSPGIGTDVLASVSDYVTWYAKDKTSVKFRQLYLQKSIESGFIPSAYNRIELSGGQRRPATASEKEGDIPDGARLYSLGDLTSQSGGDSARFPIELNGETYRIEKGSWKTNHEGIKKLIAHGRIEATKNRIGYVRYLNDFPAMPINNIWADVVSSFLSEKVYVVQTNTSILQRCLLMTTDPGDLVLDPTCGSGTTAFVAEQWGRRWITIDTSRVALALARTRLMTAKLPYYKLRENGDDAKANVAAGFIYKTVPHITLKSLANDEAPGQEVLYDQPQEDKKVVRVAGPFTVESLSPHRVSDAQELIASDHFVETIVENLRRSGVQTGDKGARVEFLNLDILPGGPEVQAVGEYQTNDGPKKVALAIGPEFSSIDDDFILDAVRVAKKFATLLIVAATSFDASATSVPLEQVGLRVLRVKINPDLSMGDLLKKTGTGNLFIAFGEPDVRVRESAEGCVVEVVGVDVYDPVKGEIRSSGAGDPDHDIAAWFIDTNYNGSAFFVTHAYFLGGDDPYKKLKRALKAEIDESVWDELCSTVSRPFPKPKTGKIAVKVINHYGDEVMKVLSL